MSNRAGRAAHPPWIDPATRRRPRVDRHVRWVHRGVVARLEIEDSIDLHGFAPRDVVSAAQEYVEAAARRGLGEVRLIHGRGKGVQRQRVREMLARHPLVLRFGDAPPARGGFGATLAWLRAIDDAGRMCWVWERPRDGVAAAAQWHVLESALARADTLRLARRLPGRPSIALDRRFPFVHVTRAPGNVVILATADEAAAIAREGLLLVAI
jgi:Smr domain-containing protein